MDGPLFFQTFSIALSRRSTGVPLSRWVGILLLGAALGALATWAFQGALRGPTTTISPRDNADSNSSGAAVAKDAIHALGTLEPRGGALLITSPLVGTPVRKVLVHEGQLVTVGQRLIELDSSVPNEELGIAKSQQQQ